MPVPIRPGIRPETLAKAGVAYTDTPEPGSILIPYFDIEAERLRFWRVRLAKERPDGQKYSQAPGSEPHIYFPPEVLKPADDFVLTEGEFKFLTEPVGAGLPGRRAPWPALLPEPMGQEGKPIRAAPQRSGLR
jgi:hypothetical protein